MLTYIVLGLISFAIYYSFYDNRQQKQLKQDAKNIISSHGNVLNCKFDTYKNQDTTNIFLFQKNENILISKTSNASDINMNELAFTKFQTFTTYISSVNPEMKLFVQNRSMYLFYPILDDENRFKFVVFVRNKIVFDDIISARKSNYSNKK